MDELVESTVPNQIRLDAPLNLEAPLSETEALAALRLHADENQVRGHAAPVTPHLSITRCFVPRPPEVLGAQSCLAHVWSQGRLKGLDTHTRVCSLSLHSLSLHSLSLHSLGSLAHPRLPPLHSLVGLRPPQLAPLAR